MKSAALALPALCLFVAFAGAASPEADYLAARDAAIAKIKALEAKKAGPVSDKADRAALAALQKRLRAIIGPLAVKPYPAEGEIAFDTLSENQVGSGGLDALRYAAAKGDRRIVHVTTDGLLTHYLAKPEDWWRKTSKSPPSIEEALRNDEFFTYAIGVDAALARTADLPIAPPAGATAAVALLGAWAQDVGPIVDPEIIVALRRDGKVYIAEEEAKAFKPIPACEAVWTDSMRKADAEYKKYTDGGAKDQKIFDAYTELQEKGDRAYRACYRERLPKEPSFQALMKEAQAIADRFAAK